MVFQIQVYIYDYYNLQPYRVFMPIFMHLFILYDYYIYLKLLTLIDSSRI